MSKHVLMEFNRSELQLSTLEACFINFLKANALYLSTVLYVTPHHQMRHKLHTKVLSKWLNKEK